MTTFADLVTEIESTLQGYTVTKEQLASLSGDLAATDLVLKVDDPSILSTGIYQVDDELIRITKVASDGQSAPIPSWGRGFRGSGATSHSDGALVTKDPPFPRSRIKQFINEGIGWVYPVLYAVKMDESNTVDLTKIAYTLPADVADVRKVEWREPNVYKYWVEIPRFRLDRNADVTQYPTGISIDLAARMFPGSTIKVTYTAKPSPLVNPTDDFATVTGLQDSATHVISLFAMAKLTAGLETARLNLSSIEQSDRARLIPGGTAANASKYFFGLAQEALQQEQNRLFTLYSEQAQETW